MGAIPKDEQQVTIYYNSESSIGKQTYAYINASSKEVHGIDVAKEKVTGTQWAALADKLGVDIADFIDTEHSKFEEMYSDKNVDLKETDWIKILQEKPELISWPIVVNGDQFLLIKNPSDIVKHINQ